MVSLNEQQMAAVTAADGPSLVLAGAGTGKTRVIVERMAWLVEERGIDPRYLLALTFTNKAAGEMRERFARRIAAENVPAWLGTFHSFGLFILRREMERLGRKKNFSVFDDTDQLSLMKKLVKDLPKTHAAASPREALQWISRHKQEVKLPDLNDSGGLSMDDSFRWLWTRYHEALERASAVDFDDLLYLLVRLFEDHPEACEKYQRRYRYILIDEYQDTNHAQYRIGRALAGPGGNIFAVGDEDQRIYSWRGADISNIVDFAKDYPDATVYRLEENYRSTQAILTAANQVVANNAMRLGKTLRATVKGGEKVRFERLDDADLEARFVVADLVKQNFEPRHTAILYRTNAQARLIEEALRMKGVNYVVIGGTKFYARKEIKDIVAYMRLLVNPDDDVSLRRVLNVPPRGIGGVTLERLEEYATARRISLFQVLREIESDETLGARARNSAQEFLHLVDDLTIEAKTKPVAVVVEQLLERIGYRSYVQQNDEKDFKDRLELVDEFVAGCRQYDAAGGADLQSYLQDMALMTDVDAWDPNTPAVTLMTVHSAKGLEFENVYITGLEEGLFPLAGEFDEAEEEVEEERRLAYVAMTRARKHLVLTAARSRMVYGRTRDERAVSRFVREAGIDLSSQFRRDPSAPGRTAMGAPMGPRPAAKAAAAGGAPQAGQPIKIGTRVRHAKFGEGTVMYTSGSGDKLRARIRFKIGKVATLMVSSAPLEILEGKG
ncbi:MAG: UvrD-helicase domain-containing protein [Candidatus Hydrogenedentes bacterium]|nr:UvrD-helicase domain-containing protein [Candidatus Hydrogenedentota bacterium]